MADDTSKRLERAGKLLETMMDLHDKSGEVLEELRKILAGEQSVGDLTRKLSDHYLVTWEARYGSKYAWQGAKDASAAKRLVKLLGLEELKSRATRFLKDDDPFYVKARHPFALFASNINRYAPEGTAPLTLSPVVGGCVHEPQCQTDLEHTRRRSEERRTSSDRRAATH